MTSDEHTFYTAQSLTSESGEFAQLFDALPADPRRVVGVVSGLVLRP